MRLRDTGILLREPGHNGCIKIFHLQIQQYEQKTVVMALMVHRADTVTATTGLHLAVARLDHLYPQQKGPKDVFFLPLLARKTF